MILTPHKLCRGDGVYHFPGTDVTVIDSTLVHNELFPKQGKWNRRILRDPALCAALPPRILEEIKRPGLHAFTFMTLYQAYETERMRNSSHRSGRVVADSLANENILDTEPSWAAKLPFRYRNALRSHFVLHGGCDHKWCLVPGLRHHGIGYSISFDGMVQDATDAYPLGRSQGIRQLAYLHEPHHPDNVPPMEMPYPHTRLAHMYDVYVNAQCIVANNPCLQPIANEIRCAALTHDVLMPAGGDTTKLVDRQAFDEDAHYPSLLRNSAWRRFARKYRIKPKLLCSIVLGQGIGGRVLDLADKCAYLARDLHMYLGRGEVNGPSSYPSFYYELLAMSERYPEICALWKCAKVVGDDLVITNHEALYRFLRLRAMMFKGLYYNPRSRILEYITAKKFIGWAYHTGRISRDQLLTWTDWELGRYFEETIGYEPGYNSLKGALAGTYDSVEEAEAAARNFDADEDTLVLVDEFTTQTSDGTKSFCVEKNGRIMNFGQAYPEWKAEIAGLVNIENVGTRVYVVSMTSLGIHDPAIRAELKAFKEPAAKAA